MTGALGAVALLAVGSALSGCGETATAHGLHSSGPITKAVATAFANAVNLTPADVPGTASIGLEGEHKEGHSLTETMCGLRESHVHVADVQSPTFRSGGNGGGVPLQEVKSDVEVVATAALAGRKLAHIESEIQSPRARACLERAYARIFAKELSKGRNAFALGRATVSVLHPAMPRSFGIALVLPFALKVNGLTVHTGLYVDGFGFIDGQAGVSLTAIRFTRPIPTETEQRLLALLYRRAKANQA